MYFFTLVSLSFAEVIVPTAGWHLVAPGAASASAILAQPAVQSVWMWSPTSQTWLATSYQDTSLSLAYSAVGSITATDGLWVKTTGAATIPGTSGTAKTRFADYGFVAYDGWRLLGASQDITDFPSFFAADLPDKATVWAYDQTAGWLVYQKGDTGTQNGYNQRVGVTMGTLRSLKAGQAFWVNLGNIERWDLVPNNIGNVIQGLAYGNKTWVAVGNIPRNVIVASTNDGLTWREVLEAPQQMGFITWEESQKLFVAGGNVGLIYTSTDGVNWTQQTSGVTNNLYSVAYGNGEWLIAGLTGTLLQSVNAQTWNKIDVGTTSGLINISFANGRWFITGANQLQGKLLTSTDARQWQAVTSNGIQSSVMTTPTGTFKAVASGNTVIQSSTDGLTWTGKQPGNGIDTYNLYSVRAKGNLILSTGYANPNFAPLLILSKDAGETWKAVKTSFLPSHTTYVQIAGIKLVDQALTELYKIAYAPDTGTFLVFGHLYYGEPDYQTKITQTVILRAQLF